RLAPDPSALIHGHAAAAPWCELGLPPAALAGCRQRRVQTGGARIETTNGDPGRNVRTEVIQHVAVRIGDSAGGSDERSPMWDGGRQGAARVSHDDQLAGVRRAKGQAERDVSPELLDLGRVRVTR